MAEELEMLLDFASKLNNLEPGETITIDLDYTMFVRALELVVEREDRKLSRPLKILRWGSASYDIYSSINNRNYGIMSEEGKKWEIAGGEVSPDNLNGSYYLRLTEIYNFSNGTEGRLYHSKNDCIHSISLEEEQPNKNI